MIPSSAFFRSIICLLVFTRTIFAWTGSANTNTNTKANTNTDTRAAHTNTGTADRTHRVPVSEDSFRAIEASATRTKWALPFPIPNDRSSNPSKPKPLATTSTTANAGTSTGITTRRELLATGSTHTLSAAVTVAVATLALTVVTTPQPARAAAPLDAGEAIRRGASNLPGYGSSDVFYPESFAGSWKMTREVEFPSSSSLSPPPVLRLTYPVRFLRSIEDDAVVADRGFNQAELEAALMKSTSKAPETEPSPAAATTPSVVRSYEWAANNPNVLSVVLSNGTKKEIKVTKRATERTEDTVSSSEFQRVTQEEMVGAYANANANTNSVGGIPVISARRVVSKWKKVDDSRLEGIEIVYAVGGGGDPLSTGLPSLSPQQQAPTILSKSRIYLVR